MFPVFVGVTFDEAQISVGGVDQPFAGVLEIDRNASPDNALNLSDAPLRRAYQCHILSRFKEIRHLQLHFGAVVRATIHN